MASWSPLSNDAPAATFNRAPLSGGPLQVLVKNTPLVLHEIPTGETHTLELDLINGAGKDVSSTLTISTISVPLTLRKKSVTHLGPFTLSGPTQVELESGSKKAAEVSVLGNVMV